MSVVVYIFGGYIFDLVRISSVFIQTRSVSQTLDYISDIMSIRSIDTVSSCEIAGGYDYGLLKPRSPDMSTKSEVICSFSFKEPVPGTACKINLNHNHEEI